MATGPMQAMAVMSGSTDEQLVSGVNEQDLYTRQWTRLLLAGLIIFIPIPSAVQTNLLLDGLNYLAGESETLQSGASWASFIVDKLGDAGAALYFYFLYKNSGDGLAYKVKEAVAKVMLKTGLAQA